MVMELLGLSAVVAITFAIIGVILLKREAIKLLKEVSHDLRQPKD